MDSYNPRSLVKNLQLSFSLQLGATSPSTGAYYADGRHFFFHMYEPFIRDVERGIHHLSSLVSLNIFVDMVEDPAAFTRIINILRGKRIRAIIKPFVLRLKSLRHNNRVGKMTSCKPSILSVVMTLMTEFLQIFHGCAEWKQSGVKLGTLLNVSDLEIITTDWPMDPEEIHTVIRTWMSNPNGVLKRVHVWMGAEDWKEDEDFSILTNSEGHDGLPGYNFISYWEGNTWDLRMAVE